MQNYHVNTGTVDIPALFFQHLVIAVIGWIALLSTITFYAYGADKRAAQQQRHRTPESTLLLLGVLGGTLGAIAGMFYFRHKTRKRSFQASFLFACVMQISGVAAIFLVPNPFRARLRAAVSFEHSASASLPDKGIVITVAPPARSAATRNRASRSVSQP